MSVVARTCRALVFLLVVLGLPAFSLEPPTGGLEDDDVVVDYRDGTYFASLAFLVAASPAVVIDVLTDFNHMVGIVPNLESSQIVSRQGNVFVIKQRGKANFGPFSFPFESLRQIELLPDGRILGRALGGSTKHMRSELRVQAQGRGARVDYQIEVVPDRWLPASLGVPFMRHEMAEQFTALIHEMERRQGIARSR
ncbi:MAG: SRPBCC family protein [Dechloromonas sp.]|uniref:SRPBCC family protein n=1 Tax=Ferribacterium limneticum TaxID=76259 RepID=UPI001CF8F06F|nr:SRPBCC family protein [Ferribacterium limneticum]MBT9520237.1 SRPBCC family protein [Dechloromonas sp.]UCV23418.1 SRPBCC family protein [Ferribacterium limneticum]